MVSSVGRICLICLVLPRTNQIPTDSNFFNKFWENLPDSKKRNFANDEMPYVHFELNGKTSLMYF